MSATQDPIAILTRKRRIAVAVVITSLIAAGGIGAAAYFIWLARKKKGATPARPSPSAAPQSSAPAASTPAHPVGIAGAGKCPVPVRMRNVMPSACAAAGGRPEGDACELSLCPEEMGTLAVLNSTNPTSHPDPTAVTTGVLLSPETQSACTAAGGAGGMPGPCESSIGPMESSSAATFVKAGTGCPYDTRHVHGIPIDDPDIGPVDCAAIGGVFSDNRCSLDACMRAPMPRPASFRCAACGRDQEEGGCPSGENEPDQTVPYALPMASLPCRSCIQPHPKRYAMKHPRPLPVPASGPPLSGAPADAPPCQFGIGSCELCPNQPFNS